MWETFYFGGDYLDDLVGRLRHGVHDNACDGHILLVRDGRADIVVVGVTGGRQLLDGRARRNGEHGRRNHIATFVYVELLLQSDISCRGHLR